MRRKRKRRRVPRKPELSVAQILAWADAFHQRTGQWPQHNRHVHGQIAGSLGETWQIVDAALRAGCRGLPGGSSLPRLLAERRGVRNRSMLPPLLVHQILGWADAHHRRLNEWPTIHSGQITGSLGETWQLVDAALRHGFRGLPCGSSLPRLLAERRGARNSRTLLPISVQQILAWADDHHRRLKEWPTKTSGRIADASEETWGIVHAALIKGCRGLPGGSTLAQLLASHRGVRNRKALPELTVQQILGWADALHKKTGRWPKTNDGPIPGAPDETWLRVDTALRTGIRVLAKDSSLARLLAERRGARNPKDLKPLTSDQILNWADSHFRKFKKWPIANSGPIADAPGETWSTVDAALRNGIRGLPHDSSLARLLAECRGRPNKSALVPLTLRQILAWADAHFRRTGKWPSCTSGAVEAAPAVTWMNVHYALYMGYRGLPGGSSLPQLLAQRRGARNRQALPYKSGIGRRSSAEST